MAAVVYAVHRSDAPQSTAATAATTTTAITTRAGAPTASTASAPACTRYAAPWGSDRRRGTLRHPVRSLTVLDRRLWPGQTGCLLSGVYGGLQAWHRIDSSGTVGAPITIRSAPGQFAQVDGWVDIEGNYTTLENVRIDGSNTLYPTHPAGVTCRDHVSQPLVITGSHVILQHVNYYQSVRALRGSAIGIGFWGHPGDDIIRFNRIHDVGGCDFYDHLIYLAGGDGDQIYDNWMWDDPHGWGVKLDPGPTAARIWGNVIDRAGSGFNFGNSSGSAATSDNEVFDNLVVDSVGIRNPDIHWAYPGVLVTSPGMLPSSNGNRVFANDSYGNRGGFTDVASDVAPWQLTVTGNHSFAPGFANARAHDYLLVAAGARAPRHQRR